jgi:hypothetical protein
MQGMPATFYRHPERPAPDKDEGKAKHRRGTQIFCIFQ